LFLLIPFIPFVGCARAPASAPPAATAEGLFVDEYPRSGVDFVLGHGGRTPLNIRETLGHGAVLIDADGDGRLDLVLLGSDRVALYLHRGDFRFADATAASGLRQPGFWQGAATGDVDGDGRPDLYLCGYGVQALYLNRGNGQFLEITETALPALANDLPSVDGIPWYTSAGFADADGDGRLDLYVTRYVRFGPETPQLCDTHVPGLQSVCPPKAYEPQRGVFYRNVSAGSIAFRDETAAWGFDAAHGNGLGVAWGDSDGDGRVDLAVANDELPGDLFRNAGDRFVEVGAASGTAYDAEGRVHAGMGIDWGDADGDLQPDLLVTTFWGETNSLYRNEGRALFRDVAAQSDLARAGRPYVGFGAKFFDLENDGDLDVAIANGHVADNAADLRRGDAYAQPTLLFRNDGGRFVDATRDGGLAFTRPIVGRALCAGDLDNDGRVDIVVTNVEGPPLLLRNRAEPRGHWLRVRLAGAASPNRDGVGARVTVQASGRRQAREVTTGGSYLAACDSRLHFGLGNAARADEIVVRWPDGRVTRRRDVAADREVVISP
jgi:hypothetical protein